MEQPIPSNQQTDLSPSSHCSADERYIQQFKLLLTPKEFYEALDGAICQSKIYELIHANTVKHIRVGRSILIPRRELLDFWHREAYN